MFVRLLLWRSTSHRTVILLRWYWKGRSFRRLMMLQHHLMFQHHLKFQLVFPLQPEGLLRGHSRMVNPGRVTSCSLRGSRLSIILAKKWAALGISQQLPTCHQMSTLSVAQMMHPPPIIKKLLTNLGTRK